MTTVNSEQAWQRQRERGSSAALRLLLRMTLVLGRSLMSMVMMPIASYFFVTGRDARQASKQYLRRVLGSEPRWWHSLIHFYTFALVSVDRIYFMARRLKAFTVDIFSEDIIQRYHQRGEGALLLVTHIGSFDVMRVLAEQKVQLPLYILMDKQHNARAMDMLATLDPQLAEHVIDSDQDAVELGFKLKQLLDAGAFIGVMSDRLVPGERAYAGSFLRGQADFPMGPWLLASLLKVPVILCVGLYRGNRHYDLYFELLAESVVLDRKNRERSLSVYLDQFIQRLEYFVKQAPYNWFNFYSFWTDWV